MNVIRRREFLSTSTRQALAGSAIFNTLFHLRGIGGAVAAGGALPDYKALVCVFMKGGNDTNNFIIPTAGPNKTVYENSRSILGIPNANVLPVTPSTYADGNSYGFHPNLAGLKDLFAEGKLAMVANVGTLVTPTTKAAYLARSVPTPPQLFSHSDQQVQWQSSVPDQAFKTGWGGRMADLLAGANSTLGAQTSLSMTFTGQNNFQVGMATAPYTLTSAGTIPLSSFGTNYVNALNPDGSFKANNEGARLRAFRSLMSIGRTNLMEQAYGNIVDRSIESERFMSSALNGITVATSFPTTSLGKQLGMVARLIAARDNLHQRRQIFFVVHEGFDTHAVQVGSHSGLLTELNQALSAFDLATQELGVRDQVTTFGASDFSRTLTPNKADPQSAGSDHAWGTHMFVMGGAVRGGDIYGAMPNLQPNGPDDVDAVGGRGRYIPTTSVDEYAATLAKWFGVTGDDLSTVFPNLNRFAHPDLGFLT